MWISFRRSFFLIHLFLIINIYVWGSFFRFCLRLFHYKVMRIQLNITLIIVNECICVSIQRKKATNFTSCRHSQLNFFYLLLQSTTTTCIIMAEIMRTLKLDFIYVQVMVIIIIIIIREMAKIY